MIVIHLPKCMQVDVHGHRRLTALLEWMGKHSLSIFVIVSSNLAVIAVQGFYWTKPENNIVRCFMLENVPGYTQQKIDYNVLLADKLDCDTF